MAALPILETSAKSVQTTAEVCADYTCSLHRLQLKSPESTTYLLKCLCVLTDVSTRKLTGISTTYLYFVSKEGRKRIRKNIAQGLCLGR